MRDLLSLLRRRDPPLDFAATRTRADFQNVTAPRAGAEDWKPPVMNREQQTVCLGHHWTRVHPGLIRPANDQDLRSLAPSGLTDEELAAWYHGLRMQCARLFQATLNTSWSKTELRTRLSKDGLTIEGALSLVEPDRAETFGDAIKFLSD